MRFFLPLVCLATLGALLGSCTLQAKVTIVPDASPVVSATITLQAPARDAWASIRELDPTLPADPLAPALWTPQLPPNSGLTPTPLGLRLTIPAADPHRFFPGLQADPHSWDLTLDRAALRKLASLSAWAGSPALNSLVPAPGAAISETDYRDLLVYLLGPGVAPAVAQILVDASYVELTMVAPQPIVSAPGAVSVSGKTALFRWPLARALTLTPPLRVHLIF